MVADSIKEYSSFYIYGAQVVAYGAYVALRRLTRRTPAAFLVSDLCDNPEQIDNVPVMTFDKADRCLPIIVAVTELLHKEIVISLKEQGFTQIFSLTAHDEHLLMSVYFADLGKFPLAKVGSDNDIDFMLYEVHNHRDNPLLNPPKLAKYEQPIQAGAALATVRLPMIGDDSGNNISAKNKQYCEMTAVYWLWNNTNQNWIGIEHYRRHLLVSPDMLTGDVDAILPLPYLCYPDTLHQFRRFVSEDVVELLTHTLEKLHPAEYEQYLLILHGKYQYTYNLLCARRAVFDDYCAWFFRITEYMETQAHIVPAIANTRALSYVAEVLTSLYFMSKQSELKIYHAEKAIYT